MVKLKGGVPLFTRMDKGTKVNSKMVWSMEKGNITIFEVNFILVTGLRIKSMEVVSTSTRMGKGIWVSLSIIWNMVREYYLNRMDVNIEVNLPTIKDMVLGSIMMLTTTRNTSKPTRMVN